MRTAIGSLSLSKVEPALRLGPHFRHPMEVVYHARLTASEKRAILSAWASEACAVGASPMMQRQSVTGVEARYDEIADALRALDEEEARYERLARALDRNSAAIRLGSATRRRIPRSDPQIVTSPPAVIASPKIMALS